MRLPRTERKNIIARGKANPKKYMRLETHDSTGSWGFNQEYMHDARITLHGHNSAGGMSRKVSGPTMLRRKSVDTLSVLPHHILKYGHDALQ